MYRKPFILILFTILLIAGLPVGQALSAPLAGGGVLVENLSAGSYHTCWLKGDGTLACWGRNDYGQATPPDGMLFIQVSAGNFHTCGLHSDGTLACWGAGETDTGIEPDYGQSLPPTGTFRQVGTGAFHSCALSTDDAVVCWGDNSRHQFDNLPSAEITFIHISVGENHACGVTEDQTVLCWGNNSFGQATPPVETLEGTQPAGTFGGGPPPIGSFVQVSAGAFHTCGLHFDGTISCWGAGTTDTGISPDNGQSVPPAGAFARISAGALHTCALRSDSTVACWGAGETNTGIKPDFGQSMPPAGEFIYFSAGTYHTCGLRSNSSVVCWGSDAFGQLARARTFLSAGAQDGWILESSRTSTIGGSLNSTAGTFRLGDDSANRQYRAILSFNTNSLPDQAIIQSALVKITQSGAPVGSDPFTELGNLWVDIRKGPFGSAAALALEDFNAGASANQVGVFNYMMFENHYAAELDVAGRSKINKTGLTQLRLYFATGDNRNRMADFIKFLSGDAARGKPELVITYSLP